MQMTVPVWLYLLVLSPWLQPSDGGKLIQIEREKAIRHADLR